MIFARYFLLVLSLAIFSCQSHMTEVKDENGNVIQKYEVNKDNEKHGQYSAYSEDGQLTETATYSHNKLEGERKLYDANGNIEIVENYKNNITEGPYQVYYPDGKVKFETVYTSGVLNGTAKSYSADGQLTEEVTFFNNEENGPFTEYYDNGNIEWEGTYLNGDNEFGLLKNYDEAGELIKKMMCDSLAVCRTIWTKADGDITPKF
jgi:antitoxin component YwqK of YwqJK toxin-antitoxin module